MIYERPVCPGVSARTPGPRPPDRFRKNPICHQDALGQPLCNCSRIRLTPCHITTYLPTPRPRQPVRPPFHVRKGAIFHHKNPISQARNVPPKRAIRPRPTESPLRCRRPGKARLMADSSYPMPKREISTRPISAGRSRQIPGSRAQKRRFMPKTPNNRSAQKSHFPSQRTHFTSPKCPVNTRHPARRDATHRCLRPFVTSRNSLACAIN